MPRLAGGIELPDDVVDRNRAREIIIIGNVLARRHEEVVSDRRVRISEIVDRQSVATREFVQERHSALRIRKALVFQRYDEHATERRYAARLLIGITKAIDESAGLGVRIRHDDVHYS